MSKNASFAQGDFDPNSLGVFNGNYFGLPYGVEDSEIVIVEAPWDVTVSYGEGCSRGPERIMQASLQVDYMTPFMDEAWKMRLGTLAAHTDWLAQNDKLREKAKQLITFYEEGHSIQEDFSMQKLLNEVNQGCSAFHDAIEARCSEILDAGKKVLLLGGDHSTPLGYLRALSKRQKEDFSILQIDAHADLRPAYEGFEFSHASILHNSYGLPRVDKVVQVGIRDFCPQEADLIKSENKISTFFDWQLQKAQMEGKSWKALVEEIIAPLGKNVYITFDIDGLDPRFCPHTGTPVPGGLEYQQAVYLMNAVVESGRRLVGADLVEVAPSPYNDADEWDANVGARMLFTMAVLLNK
jgi:agmatinase